MKILKFGGTSVGSPQAIKQSIDIIIESLKEEQIAVVVSAFSKITDQLIETATQAKKGDKKYIENFNLIEARHLDTAKELISEKHLKESSTAIKETLEELNTILHGIFLIRELSPRSLDLICSFGERLSAYTISQAINSQNTAAEFLDARKVVITNENFGHAIVDFKKTNLAIQKHFNTHQKLQIITGFIGSTEENETTTLGRGGSDYSAAIFGAALNATIIEIWTDVDGIMTADPRKVEKAFPIRHLSYEEAMEMSHFGAKVIHPPTMQPAMQKNIPIAIRNTFNPDFSGSIISSIPFENNLPIRGVSSINSISLVQIQGSGLIGVAGISKRLFGALAKEQINIILISQASSEHSICFAINPKDTIAAEKSINEEFENEIKSGVINPPKIENGLSIIAVVGKNMQRSAGTAGKIFQALGENGINIIAIAQGSSELNISMVVEQKNEAKGIQVIHDSLFLSGVKALNVYLIGPGLIGKTLLTQIHDQQDFLQINHSLEIKLIGLANSRKMLIESAGIDLNSWDKQLEKSSSNADLKKFLETIYDLNLPNSILVDCTSSEEVAEFYPEILSHSISIVTPNKKCNSGNLKHYLKTLQAASKSNSKFYYETNVGAGLPILGTLHDLLISGDQITKIEAVLSGTLSYIFNSFNQETSFSQIVEEAQKKGYTEPDPRDDLNGADVARKILILARETGKLLELEDIEVENLIPENCRKTTTVEEFFKKLKENDHYFKEKLEKANQAGKVLRYIAKYENGKGKVALEEVDNNHPFFNLSGSDNIISFTTNRYNKSPLVVKGPGAGAEVTAAGVFADIIKIANISFNKRLSKYSFIEKLKNNQLTISLVGMSNIGKTTWSNRLATLNFNAIECDKLIEKKLSKQLAREGLKNIDGVSKWLGQPFEKNFKTNQAKYLKYENLILEETLENTITKGKNTIIDTTGSVIYCQENILSKLKKNSIVVYIEATKDMEETMYQNFIKIPKPIIWGNLYDPKKPMEKCYKSLLEYRRKLYENIADIRIPFEEVNPQKITATQFLELIQEYL